MRALHGETVKSDYLVRDARTRRRPRRQSEGRADPRRLALASSARSFSRATSPTSARAPSASRGAAAAPNVSPTSGSRWWPCAELRQSRRSGRRVAEAVAGTRTHLSLPLGYRRARPGRLPRRSMQELAQLPRLLRAPSLPARRRTPGNRVPDRPAAAASPKSAATRSLDFARDAEERDVKAALHEQSLIAYPIESYGERIGAVVMSQSDPRRNFDAEDLEFAQVGRGAHRRRQPHPSPDRASSQEGHRAAEELARAKSMRASDSKRCSRLRRSASPSSPPTSCVSSWPTPASSTSPRTSGKHLARHEADRPARRGSAPRAVEQIAEAGRRVGRDAHRRSARDRIATDPSTSTASSPPCADASPASRRA